MDKISKISIVEYVVKSQIYLRYNYNLQKALRFIDVNKIQSLTSTDLDT